MEASTAVPADIRQLEQQLDAAERAAAALVAGLGEEQGRWRAAPGSWSVSECLDHLASAKRMYVSAMRPPAARAREQGRARRGPALPGLVGRCFVWLMEPPVRARLKLTAPRLILPRESPGLADAFASFMDAQVELRAFVRAHADLDLAGVRFVNPFVRGLRFSLATGLHVLAAHDRRHLWQAWRVRQSLAGSPPAL